MINVNVFDVCGVAGSRHAAASAAAHKRIAAAKTQRPRTGTLPT